MADNQGTGWMYNPDGEMNKVKETERFNPSTRPQYTVVNNVVVLGCSYRIRLFPSRVDKILDPHQKVKVFLTQKSDAKHQCFADPHHGDADPDPS
jgi:hypothetical protein